MRALQRAALAALVACALAGSAWADSGTGQITQYADGTGNCHAINRGNICYFNVPVSGAVNSVRFRVNSNRADVCMTSDTGSTTDRTAEIRIWKVILDDAVPTEAGSLLITADTAFALTDSDGDCAPLTPGYWWLEVEAAPSAGDGALVTITGRDA